MGCPTGLLKKYRGGAVSPSRATVQGRRKIGIRKKEAEMNSEPLEQLCGNFDKQSHNINLLPLFTKKTQNRINATNTLSKMLQTM